MVFQGRQVGGGGSEAVKGLLRRTSEMVVRRYGRALEAWVCGVGQGHGQRLRMRGLIEVGLLGRPLVLVWWAMVIAVGRPRSDGICTVRRRTAFEVRL